MCRVLVLDHPLSVRCNTKTVNLRGEQISYSSSSFSVKTVSCGTTNWPPDSFIRLDALSRLTDWENIIFKQMSTDVVVVLVGS